jgi:predicted ATPase
MEKPMNVTIRNFGPFRRAEIELKPITLFIGKNSTGKSMLLSLLWALASAVPSEAEIRQRWGELYERVKSISSAEEAEKFLRVSMEVFKGAVAAGLEAQLRLAFGVEPKELVKVGEAGAQIAVKGACGDLHILLTDGVAVDKLDICGEDELLSSITSAKRQPLDYIVATMRFLAEKVADEYGILPGAVFLPASRACEFTYGHLVDEYRQSGRLSQGAEQLLREMGVELDVQGGELVVKTWSGKVHKLTHAPSGIREVAAAVLALSSKTIRHVFIEEPEKGLHPAAQRLMARAIVEAVNSGKFVALTTHSDYIVSELNNLIASSRLKPEMVAAYLTRAEGDSTAVERLDVNEMGIPEDEFSRVVEEILEARNELY